MNTIITWWQDNGLVIQIIYRPSRKYIKFKKQKIERESIGILSEASLLIYTGGHFFFLVQGIKKMKKVPDQF